ncbi:histone-lysine N-methyltransferase SETMAR [Caerostris darwini]|uniref:Histone-lysine N-methyltransferase SETMAR n=1 Tax=Caerostris darwini TaxID=1538125 RepID=A0AAV4Q428_9ARAC|nr:histone-lysine N-methyltransferase SETMAR [Caerostris darwini]
MSLDEYGQDYLIAFLAFTSINDVNDLPSMDGIGFHVKVETDGATCHTAGVRVDKVPRRFRTIEMARRLENWSRLEVRAEVQFLLAKNVSASPIHSQIVEVYGEEARSRQHVAKWCRSFQSSRQDVENRNMAGSGRASSSTTEINTAQVEEMIPNDQRYGNHILGFMWCYPDRLPERAQTINADRYCATLTRLREAIRRKRSGLLSEGVILLHDNARSHTAEATQELLRRFKWKMWSHSP